MNNAKQASINKVYYRSIGPKLTTNTVVLEYTVDGTTYSHNYPNGNWQYSNPSLQLFAYLGIKPTDFSGTSKDITNKTIPVVWNNAINEYSPSQNASQKGKKKLQDCDWFSPNMENINAEQVVQAFGGMIDPDPSTGNRAGIPVNREEK